MYKPLQLGKPCEREDREVNNEPTKYINKDNILKVYNTKKGMRTEKGISLFSSVSYDADLNLVYTVKVQETPDYSRRTVITDGSFIAHRNNEFTHYFSTRAELKEFLKFNNYKDSKDLESTEITNSNENR